MSASDLPALLGQCVVRVEAAGRFKGSGVLVAPNQVLTCAHVVAAAVRDGETVSVVYGEVVLPTVVRNHTPSGISDGRVPDPYPWPDLAWLEVTGPEDASLDQARWVELDRHPPRVADVLVSRGFSEAFERGVPSGHPAEFRVEGPVERPDGTRWQLTAAQAAPGMSGSPVLNTRTGRLSGLLTRSRNAETNLGGWAVQALAGLNGAPGFGGLLAELHTHHFDADPREAWLAAAGVRNLLAAPYLPLPKRHTPATLVVARYGVVPFDPAREPALAELLAWCEGQESLVRLLVGPAGTGKTRLAAEVASRLAGRGWLTGFLPVTEQPVSTLARLTDRGDPVLLVVDYAETRSDLANLLAAVADAEARGNDVRVLLLARASGDWWEQLPSRGDSPSANATALVGAQAVELDQLDDLVDDPTSAYRQAAEAFAQRQGLPLPEALPPLVAESATRWSYLLAQMAALDAIGTPGHLGQLRGSFGTTAPEAPRVPEQVVAAVLARERAHWRRTADTERERLTGVADTVLDRTIAALSLLGAADEYEAAATLARVPDLTDATEQDRRGFARWVQRHYPASSPGEEWTSGLQPDLLAEAQCTQSLSGSAELATMLLEHLSPSQAGRALTLLTRATRHQPKATRLLREALERDLEHLGEPAIAVAIETGQPAGDLLTEVLRSQCDALPVNLVKHLYWAIPKRTLTLREPSLLLAKTLVYHCRHSGNVLALADSLRVLSYRQHLLAGRDEALDAIEEAVTLYRRLDQEEAGTVVAALAESLNDLASRLGSVGRRDDALRASDEAVRLSRALVAEMPRAFRPGLAESLSNYSVRLGAVGHLEAALVAIEEAVGLRRKLAREQPQVFLPELAKSLSNLAVRSAALARRDDALAAIEEAVRLRRTLVQERPDAYLPDLAMSLSNLSVRLAAVGRHEEALAAVDEAVGVRRKLAAESPNVFLPELTTSLGNLSMVLARVGRHADALAAAEQAVELRRGLATKLPAVFAPELATSLSRLSVRLATVGRLVEALEAAQEAVALRRGLMKERPLVVASQLAISLVNLSERFAALGRRDEALAAIEEAVGLRRGLAAERPRVFLSELADALHKQSKRLGELGRREGALEAAREAVTSYRGLPAEDLQRFAADFVSALEGLAVCLEALLLSREAEAAREEAIAFEGSTRVDHEQ